tara:strand:- start:300 stop:503 length:204 start_codon:yes stop_codon:yes gene_type:complete
VAKKGAKNTEDGNPSYIVISRTGTNPLSVAVENAMKEGYIPLGGVTISTELKGRERVTTYHQAMYMS